MKKIVVIVLVLISIINATGVVIANSYSGWADGTYAQTGDIDGKNAWSGTSDQSYVYTIKWVSANNRWEIWTSGEYEYYNPSTASLPPETGWFDYYDEEMDGDPLPSNPAMTVTIQNPNTAPTASNFTANPTRYVTHTFSTADFSYNDADADALDHVRITAVPTNGTLYVDANANDSYDGGEALSNSNTVNKANLDAGNLQYISTNGTSSSFTFDVNDGTDYSSSTYTATLTVGAATDPAITSATYDASTGALVVTGTNIYANPSGIDIDVSTLTFTGEGGATYTLTDSPDVERTSPTQFTVTLSATDKAAVGQILNKNGTTSSGVTTYNLAAAEDWLTVVDAAATIADATNGITVANVPAPTITSATYNAATGVVVVTGTSFVKKAGATNDIDVSHFTFTGEGGETYTVTTSPDVEITSGTSFSFTLNSTDKLYVNSILNKDGTISDGSTTYNLAAAEDWATGADAAVNVADLTNNGITVSNVTAPAISSATYDYSTETLVVTGTNFVKKSGAANDVDVSLLTFRGEAGGTYTATSASDVEVTSATEFTVTLSAADALNINGLLNKDGPLSDDISTYRLSAADNWMTGAAASSDISDAINSITVSNYTTPTITSATYDASSAVLTVTGTKLVKEIGASNDVDISTLTLTGEDGSTYTLSSSDVEVTSATAFSVTLNATDKLNVNSILNKNGTSSSSGTTYNLAAADNWMKSAATSVDIADLTGNGITVSNVVAPAITSATYNASTGVVTVTGTNFVKKAGATNDIDINLFTFTGEGGSTYTLTASTDVEITSSTSFSITLDATDKLNVNSILNKNGTSSEGSTTYNLAAAEDWAAGSDPAANIADLTGNGITVSGVTAPAITSATYDYSTETVVVTGTNFVKKSGAVNDVDVSLLTFRGEAGATYTVTSVSDVEITSATEFTVTLSAVDALKINGLMNKDGTLSDDVSTYGLIVADNWMTGAAASTDISAVCNNVVVSNYTAPTITSSTYDATSGILTVTGTKLVKKAGASNDVDVSLLTITGEGAGTYTLTSSDIEVASATSFSISLNATDKLNINGLLNKNGTTSGGGTTYNLAGADNWCAGSPSSVNIADLTGNGITVSNVSAPTVTSATYDFATGSLVVSGTNLVTKSGAFNDIDVSLLTITGEGAGTYTLTSSDVEIASATEFTVTLNATDKLNINGLLNKNGTTSGGGTTYNLAAADNWATGADPATDIADGTGNAITVSNVTAPTITSATYNASTGVVVVTGTNLVKKTGATNDIDISLFTFTGEGGATYTITSSTDVEITSGTSFSFALNATDKLNVNSILNKDGTVSDGGTTYNFAAADDWSAGSDPSVNIADIIGNGITVSNVTAPAITSATYDYSSETVVVTGTNFVKKSGALNDVDVSLLTFRGEAGATYTVTSASDVEITSATEFTVTLSAVDALNINGLLNKDGTLSDDISTYNLAAADNWMPGAAASTDISDATNGITVSNFTLPTITSATYDASTGVLAVTATKLVEKAGASNDIDVSLLTITGEGAGTYTLTSSDVDVTSATAFAINLNTTDKLNINGLLNKNGNSSGGGTTYNLAGADNWCAGSPATSNIADLTGNGITVSNVTAPTVTSATYDFAAGSLVVTGTNLVKKSGASNDIDVSLLTITGEGAGTYTLTSSDVEITSATEFTVTLNTTDKLNINGLLHKNGTTSGGGTTYNLAAADNWASGANPATDIADLAGNAISVFNVAAPTITSATFDATTGVLVVSGSNFAHKAGVANDIDVSLLTLTGEGGGTYTLTATTDVEVTSMTEFSVTILGADLTAMTDLFNKNGTSSVDNTTYNLAAADNWATAADGPSDISDVSGNGITASNVIIPTITSATYNTMTGICVVTGTRIRPYGGGADIDISTFTFTGEGGTYTLTNSADVERDSQTQFTITLSATDKTSVNALLDKSGTSSSGGTTYNLAAGEDWNRGIDPAANISDVSGNGITVTMNTTPLISIDNTSLAYTENGAATQIDAAATVSDADGDADWNGGTLTAQITANAEANDSLSIPDNGVGTINTSGTDLRDGSTVIGTLSASEGTVGNGTVLTITFNGNASNARVQQVLRAISYHSGSDNPGTSDRTITITVTDNKSGSANDTRTVAITLTNDAPSISSAITDTTVTEDFVTPINYRDLNAVFTDIDGDNLTFSVLSKQGKVTPSINGADSVLVLTAVSNATGLDTLIVKAKDATDSIMDTVLVTVTAVNDAPTLSSVTAQTIDEDNSLTVLLSMTNGADVDNSLSDASVVVASGSNYTVSGKTITPTVNYNGPLTVPVKITDGTDTTSAVNLSVTVNAVNDAPTLTSVTAQTIDEDNSLAVLLSMTDGADVDNTLTNASVIVESGSNYTVSGKTITPAANYNGSLTVPIKVTDGPDTTSAVNLTVTVNAVNDAPTLTSVTAQTIDEDNALTVLLSMTDGADVDNTLTDASVIVEAGSNYTVSGKTITPTANYNGALTVPVKITDGTVTTSAVNLSVTVTAVNDAPAIATAITDTTVTEDFTTAIQYRDLNSVFTDVENGSALTFSVVSLQGKVTPSVNGADSVLVLAAVANANGIDTVVVTASDGSLEVKDSVEVTVTAVNDAPTISSATAQTIAEDGSLTILLSMTDGTDVDNTLTDASIVVEAGSNYTVSGMTITPFTNFNGVLTVPVKVTDGTLTSAAVNMSVTVTAVNDAPTITSATSQTIAEDGSLTILLSMTDGADVDNTLTDASIVVEAGSNYTVVGKTITPAVNFNGVLTVPVKVTDGTLTSAAVNMSVTVTAVNDAPTITTATAQTIAEDGSLAILLSMTDGADVDNTLTDASILVESGANYTVSGTTITPTENFNGALTVPVKVTDGTLTSAVVNMSVTVTPVNDAPTLSSATAQTIAEDSSLTVLLSMTDGADVDNTLTDASIVVETGSNYTVSGTTITPVANYVGALTVPVKVTDGALTSAAVNMSVTVTAMNDAPTITTANAQTIAEDGSLTVLLSMTDGADVDNTLTDESIIVEAGSNYTVEGTTITPVENYNGALTVPVKVTDGALTSAAVNMSVTVTAVNDAPTVTSATAQTIIEDSTLVLTLAMVEGEADVDGDALTITALAGTNYTVSGSSITPTLGFVGLLDVSVVVTDGTLQSSPVVMKVTVLSGNAAPVLASVSPFVMEQDVAKTLSIEDVAASDEDGDALTLLILTGANYTVTGTTITPATGFTGTLSIPFMVTDGKDSSNTITKEVVVKAVGVNNRPEIDSLKIKPIEKNSSLTVTPEMVVAFDADGDALTTILGAGENYTVKGTVITPTAEFAGIILVPVSVTDGVDTSEIDTARIHVFEKIIDFHKGQIQLSGSFTVEVAPNPAQKGSDVRVRSALGGYDQMRVKIYDHVGNLITEGEGKPSIFWSTYTLNLAEFPHISGSFIAYLTYYKDGLIVGHEKRMIGIEK